MKKIKRIWKAWRLYRLGKRLERARERLRRLYEQGVGAEKPEMCRAIRRFNALCNRWTVAEEKYNSGKL